MALKLFVVDDVAGTCDLRDLAPYTSVTSNNGSVVVVATVDPVTGQPSYDLAAAVDVNVNNFSYNAVTKEITLTETDGDSYTINISDLVDTETVTTLVADGAGGFNYTNELGAVVNIPATPIFTASLGVERIGNDFQMDIDSLPDGVATQCGDQVAHDRGGIDVRVPAILPAQMFDEVALMPFELDDVNAPTAGGINFNKTVVLTVPNVPACHNAVWIRVFSQSSIDYSQVQSGNLNSSVNQAMSISSPIAIGGIGATIARAFTDATNQYHEDRDTNALLVPLNASNQFTVEVTSFFNIADPVDGSQNGRAIFAFGTDYVNVI